MADGEPTDSSAKAAADSKACTAGETAEAKPLHATRLSTLLESGKYSDLTLKCVSRNWKAHKSVLCIQSDFFAKACDGGFKEASTNTIDLSEDNEHAVAAIIHFMYHGNYDVNAILPESDREARIMLLHVRVVGLAQKYFIQPLQKYAKDLAIDAMQQWDGAPSVFADAVCEVYSSTMNAEAGITLRKHAVSVAIDNATILFSPDDSEEDIHTRETLIDETPGFIGEWATAISGCHSQQSSTIASLVAVNESLNADNVKLNKSIGVLESHKTQLRSQIFQANKETETLRAQINNLPFKIPVQPTRLATNNYDPEPKCYLCPNCEAYFVKSMRIGSSFQHNCYEKGWKRENWERPACNYLTPSGGTMFCRHCEIVGWHQALHESGYEV